MGMAMLAPGISGGTMIVVMGLYDEFVTSLADVTRLRISRRNMLFLVTLGVAAALAIVSFAGLLSGLVGSHRSAMFSLFIGMTLGGVPMLLKMLGRPSRSAIAGILVGLGAMLVIAATNQHGQSPPSNRAPVNHPAHGQGVEEDLASVVQPAYARDVAAGALGMSAMVLPGISGAYLLLILGRYETILAAIDLGKDFATSGGGGDPRVFLRVVIPVAVGSVLGLVLLTNLLKWMLHRHPAPMVGMLLGILCGSVVGIWPFNGGCSSGEIGFGVLLAAVGFVATVGLSRIRA